MTAASVEQVVATRVGIQKARGSVDPAASRTSMVPRGGIKVTLEVLMARKSAIESEATPGRGFKLRSSTIAFSPKGVAALPSPSMLAAMFRIMALMAG